MIQPSSRMIAKVSNLVFAPYFSTYLKLVEEEDLLVELDLSRDLALKAMSEISSDQWNHRYAEGKWTIKELFHHVIQTELIFNFRALTIASESKPMVIPGFDENDYVAAFDLTNVDSTALKSYFSATREQTKALFQTLSAAQLSKIGNASGHDVQVEALFYISSGHTRHHLNVLNERYLT